MEEEIRIDEPLQQRNKDDQSEKKKVRQHGLVPPPPYYTKNEVTSQASSSDNETCESTVKDDPYHLQNIAAVRNEKTKPMSVRRNRFNQKTNQETEENEGSHKAYTKDAVLQPPPYRRNYGDSSETRRSSLEREGKYTRGISLPPEPILSSKITQAPTRAASLEPDGMKAHIHPKLPNYDDLASRIASLTER